MQCISRITAIVMLVIGCTQGSEAQLKQHIRGSFEFGLLGDTAQWHTVPQYKATIANEATSVIAIRLMRDAQPTPGQYVLAPLDTVLNFAEQEHLKVAGHALVWHTSTTPSWVCALPKAQMLQAMRNHIHYMLQYRAELFYVWDVVNEALSVPLAENCWRQVIGYPEYVIAAFAYAREVAPSSILLRYNETFGEANERLTMISSTFALFDLMPASMRPDVIGVQAHFNMDKIGASNVYLTNFRHIISEAARRRMQVHVTEMDVYQGDTPDFVGAANVYREMFAECYRSVNCTSFATWGVYDGLSWRMVAHPTALPLLFDAEFTPKPAYQFIKQVMQSHPRQGLIVSPAGAAIQVLQ